LWKVPRDRPKKNAKRWIDLRGVVGGLFNPTFRRHKTWVMSVAWSPNGTRLASCEWNGTIRVWDATNLRELFVLPDTWSSRCVAWSPDGSSLASGGDDH